MNNPVSHNLSEVPNQSLPVLKVKWNRYGDRRK